ncbi:MAG: glycosyltransferase family 4 protein [Gammaproteobacteria bacterium]
MKVMHVEAGRHLYGGARQVLYLAEGLAARDIECAVVCPTGSEIAARLAHMGIPVFPIAMGGDLDFRLIGRLRKLIKEFQPDVIHLHSRRGADWFGGLAARRFSSIPVILSRRVDNEESVHLVHYKYRLFDRVVTISRAIRSVLEEAGVPPEKLRVVHSAVKTSTWERRWDRLSFAKTFFPESSTSPDSRKAPVIGMVAQLINRKGHRFVLESIPAIQKSYPNVRLVFFGRGPELARLQMQAEKLGIADVVTFAGFRKDINHWLGCLDVFIHPPLTEGLGVAVLQAAAASLPIVASRVGGVTEIIEDRVNGLLIDPESPEQIAEGVLTLLNDREAALEMGKAAHQKVVEQFSVDAMVEGNIKVYRELLEEARDG